MKLYCSKCGSGHSYSMQKPKFCANCGKSYMSTSTPSTVKKKRIVAKPVEAKEYSQLEDDEEFFEVGIDSLEFDLKTSSANVHKLGDIVGSATEEQAEGSRDRDPSYNNGNIEKDFLNDAGSIKKS